MREEVMAAGRWWMENIDKSGLAEAHLTHFRSALEEQLLVKFDGHWYPNDPRRGSGFRAIVYDARIDNVLVNAADESGVPDIHDRAPRAIVWANPGEVKVCTLNDERMMIIYKEDGSSSTNVGSTGSSPALAPQRPSRPFEVVRQGQESGGATFELLEKCRNPGQPPSR
mmetsp:Transcript_496/g.951  ORF Transcript_496/g.951 Transcript_496/m.951 type:complete len:169 (+) Transcript_496:59-565(+)